MKFMKNTTKEQREMIIDQYSQSILVDKLFDMSLNPNEKPYITKSITGFRCKYDNFEKYDLDQSISSEIESLNQDLTAMASKFKPSDLAILRSESQIFSMRREVVMIGRPSPGHDVDIDLSFESDKTCTHISRFQAILSFLEDFQFYIENVGQRPFRINGALIYPGAMAIIPAGAILDFAGTLLLFIPNIVFIETIKRAVQELASARPKKRQE